MTRPATTIGLALLIAVPVSVGVYMAAFKSSGDSTAALVMAVGIAVILAVLVGAMGLIGSPEADVAAGVLPDGVTGDDTGGSGDEPTEGSEATESDATTSDR